MLRFSLFFILIVFLNSACAVTSGTGGPSDTRRPRRASNLITRADILDRASTAQTAFEAVQRLRSTWLRPVGTTSARDPTVRPQLYVNNVRSPGGLDFMNTISITLVEEIRYYSASEATTQWGTGHTGGAIEVITDARRTSPTRPPRDRDDRPTDGSGPTFTFEPYQPFVISPVLHVNGASSIVTAPSELGDFWTPQYAMGGGVGLTTTRNVTLVVAMDYNRFSFQEDAVLAFLESAPGSYRLRTREGVEVHGAPMTLLNISANAKFHPATGRFRPYGNLGFGYMRMNAGAFSVTGPGGSDLPFDQFVPGRADGGDAGENSVSLSVGGGFDVRLTGELDMFVDARYVIGFRGPRYSDVTGDLQLLNTQYYPFRVGMSLRLANIRISQY